MELINFLLAYIPLDYIVIIGGLIVVGEMFKKFTTLPNYFLTTALPVLGAICTSLIYLTSADTMVTAELIKQICIGLLMGWSATGGYEWFKNTFLVDKEEKKVIAREPIKNDKEESNEILIETTEEVKENQEEVQANEETVQEENQENNQ